MKIYMVILKKQKIDNIYTKDTVKDWCGIVPDDWEMEYSPTWTTIEHQQYLFDSKEKAIAFLDEQDYLQGNGGLYIDKRTNRDLKEGFIGGKYYDGRWEGFCKEMEIK